MYGTLNYKGVACVMGRLVGVEGLLLCVPLSVAVAGGESDWPGFAVACVSAQGI